MTCGICALYQDHRGPRIREEIAKISSGKEADEKFAAFMDDFHAKHEERRRLGRITALMAAIHELDSDKK